VAIFIKRKLVTIENLLSAIEAKGENGATDLEIAKALAVPVKSVYPVLRQALYQKLLRTAYRRQSDTNLIEAQTSLFFVKPTPAIPLA
jgi:hypothetical protein